MDKILTALIAALDLAESLIPVIEDKAKAGDVTPAEQQAVRDRYEQLRDNFDEAFNRPEWKIDAS